MQELIAIATRVAPSDVSVLITGPNGAGKEKIADIIHANSAIREGPFMKGNAGALPRDLMEAELFGAEAGAFTGAQKARTGRFEAADGGTLFLDEIGNLSLDGQRKAINAIQIKKQQDSAEAGSDQPLIKKAPEQQKQGVSDTQSRQRNSSKHSMASNSDLNEGTPMQAIDRFGDQVEINKHTSTSSRQQNENAKRSSQSMTQMAINNHVKGTKSGGAASY